MTAMAPEIAIANHPGLLKLALAISGISVEGRAAGDWIELVLEGDVWARARVDPASALKLIERGGATFVRDGIGDGQSEAAARVVPTPEFAARKTPRGISMCAIAQVRGSYATVALGGGCGLGFEGRACAFCLGRELTEKAGEVWAVDDVIEALRGAFDEGAAEAVHLQVGYFPGDDAGVGQLAPYLEAIHRHFDTMVAVTMHPPAALRAIDLTYASGVDALSYNLEAADAETMARHFPGRARFFGRPRYIEALAHAARVFPSGAVWSELEIGLSPVSAIRTAIDELAQIGVLPLLGVAPASERPRDAAQMVAQAAPLCAALFESTLKAGLNMSWARDIFERDHAARSALFRARRAAASAFAPAVGPQPPGRPRDPLAGAISPPPARPPGARLVRLLPPVSAPENRGGRAPLPHELEEVVIDTRPIALILLSQSVRPFMLIAGAAAFVIIATAAPAHGLSVVAQRALAVFAIAVIYWVTGALPLMVTSLLVIVLLGVSGVMPPKNAYALFGNETIFFLLSAFMLAAAVNHRGLGKRIALGIFGRFGRTPAALVRAIYLLSAAMSFLIPEHAVAAMVFPIVLDLAASMKLEPGRSRYATAMFLAMAWGVNIGGIGTLLGGARGPLALGILGEATGQSISFLRWSLATVPLVAILLVAGYFVLSRYFRSETVSVEDSVAELGRRYAELGRMKFEEKAVAAILALTVMAWLFGSTRFGLAGIAILAVVALFVFNLLSWHEVEEYVNWGIILMYGGAIALGSALDHSGAAAYLASATLGRTQSPALMLAILSLITLLSAEALSHSAVVAALLPVGLGLARRFGIAPRSITLTVAVPAGLTFVLPVGTPSIALAYSSGYLRTRELLGAGALMWLCAWLGLNLIVHLYWPLIGLGPFSG